MTVEGSSQQIGCEFSYILWLRVRELLDRDGGKQSGFLGEGLQKWKQRLGCRLPH